MRQLYHAETLEKLKKEYKAGWWAGGIIMLFALAVCIYLAASAKTINLRQHETAAILVFLICGWICITGYYAFLDPVRRQMIHCDNMLTKEPEILEGKVTLLKTWVRIPKSITIRDVLLEDEQGGTSRRVRLNRRFAREFPRESLNMTLEVRSGYITGYGPAGEVKNLEAAGDPALMRTETTEHQTDKHSGGTENE